MDTPPYAPPTGYRPAIGRESKGPLAQRTLCAQQDLALILEHLTTKPLETPLDPKSVEDSAHLIYADPETLSESERVRLWTLLDYFSNRMRPVTIEGLRLTDKFCRRKRFLQARGLGLVGIFVFTLLLQFYAMAGARTFAEVEQTAKEFFGVVDGVNLMQNARPELATETERARLFAISPDYVHLHDRYEALRTRQCYAYQGLYQWNAMWTSLAAWLRLQSPKAYWGTERPCSQDDADRPQIKYGTEIVARSLLDVLQTLVLPSMFAVLGAWVNSLRDELRQIRERNLSRVAGRERSLKMLLGAVVGGVLGFFYSPNLVGAQLTAIPLLGLAFVAGYNVELLFALFDKITALARQKYSGGERRGTAEEEGA